MDIQASLATQLIESVAAPAASSLPSHLGQNINVKV